MQKLFSTVLVALVVSAGAALPQTFTLTQTFPNPTPASSDQFGNAVAAVGNKILVGARNDDTGASNAGAVYLFDGASSTPELTILNPTPATNALFGSSVTGFGNDLLAGAPGANAASGEVYLFDGTTGALLQTFSNPNLNPNTDQFGFAVAAVGNNILVGAPFNDTGATDAGIAYLFDASGTLLHTFLNPTPLPSTGVADQFGSSLAGVGNNVLIGAPNDDTGATNAGAAYLFDGNTGTLLRTFTNPSPTLSDQFGGAVAVVGSNVLIGTAFEDNPTTNSGVAYLFDVNIGPPIQTFQNPTPGNTDLFSFSVAAFGNNVLAVIGAPLDDAGASNAGASYLYDVTVTSPLQTFLNPAPVSGDQFGFAIAAGGNNIIIAAPFNDTGAADAGTVYLYSSNAPPVADAGADQTIECTSPSGALAMLDGSGSTDPNSDQLTYTWRKNGDVIAGPATSATAEVTLSHGNHTIELTVDDGNGATDTDEVIVNVVDTTPPAITLNGATPMTLECHVDSYTEPGASVSDACDASPALVITGSVNNAVLGAYTLTYTATDANGNSAATTRTVIVVDTTPPAITLNGANPMTLECLTPYVEPDATVSDACDASPSRVISGSVNVNVPGTYTLTYTASDASGNSASTTRSVNVECPLPYPFVLLAKAKVTIDHQLASAGDIHSNNKIEFRDGNPSIHTGNLTAVGDITINKNNTIDGDVTAGKNLALQGNATITGTATSNATVASYPLPTFSFNDGIDDVTVPPNGSRSLAPGSYHDVKVEAGGNLLLNHDGSSGEYFFHKLDLKASAMLSIDVSQGPVEINLVQKFHFASDMKVAITPAVEISSRFVTFNIMGSDGMHIHERSNVSGNINAPNATVILYDEAFFKGAISAKEIEVQKNVTCLHHDSDSSAPLAKISTSAAADTEESCESVTATGVKEYALEQNYPNPFWSGATSLAFSGGNPGTEIRFALPEAGHAVVKIFNTLGEEIRTLADKDFAAGSHVVRWNAQNDRGEKVPSGMYFYRLVTPKFSETKKMILAK